MKSKLAKIWGIGLALTLLVSLLISALPVSAGTLSFGNETTPTTTNSILAPFGLDILDLAIAADGMTIYAATDNVGNHLYKSTDGGNTWAGLTTTDNVTRVAVSPDDANTIAYLGNTGALTTNLNVKVSTNGGSSFTSLGTVQSSNATPAIQLNDITIAPISSGVKYIGVGGTAGGAGSGLPGFYYFNLGATVPAWKNAAMTPDFTGGIPATAGVPDSIQAIAFSPNFASDQVAVAVSEEDNVAAGANITQFHIVSFNTKQWDTGAGFTSYPVALRTAVGGTSNMTVAAIALDPAYLGSDDTMRNAFVAATISDSGVAGDDGGLFRLTDTSLKVLKDNTNLRSVAYNGTTLVAGAAGSTVAYRSTDMLSSSPTVSASTLYKRAGGTMGAVVGFAGTKVVEGTAGDESAFAVSTDGGKSFNDVSLIDTVITTMEDVYICNACSGSANYMVTTSNTSDTSLWYRTTGAWQRILSLQNDSPYIVRGAPEDPATLYVAKKGGANLYTTKDAGQTRWTIRTTGGSAIQDLAVESADIAYIAISGGTSVSKSTNNGFTWGSGVATKLAGGTISTITSIAASQLVAGSNTGYVAYSMDGNSSWTGISSQVDSLGGATQVTANTVATGGYIFAAPGAAGAAVKSWKIDPATTSWTDTVEPAGASALLANTGIAYISGTLYVSRSGGTDNVSDILRTLGPTATTVSWSIMAQAGDIFGATPSALRTSVDSTGTKLWVIDNFTPNLVSYIDTLAAASAAPALQLPANNFLNKVNNITGYANDVTFTWARDSKATNYTITIYGDSAMTQQVFTYDTGTTTADPVVVILGPNQAVGTGRNFSLALGTTYYWRVKAIAPVSSPWSELRTFSTEAGVALVPSVLSPPNGTLDASRTPSFSWSPVAGTTQYRFVLADNVAMTAPIVDAKVSTTGYAVTALLAYGKTYYWQVKALLPVEGDWSALSNFAVMAQPVTTTSAPPVTPTTTVITVPPPVTVTYTNPPATTITIPPATTPAPITPAFIWAVIIIGAILLIAVVILIVRTRRAP